MSALFSGTRLLTRELGSLPRAPNPHRTKGTQAHLDEMDEHFERTGNIICICSFVVYSFTVLQFCSFVVLWFYNSIICRNTWLYNFYDPVVVFLLGKFIVLNTQLKRTHLAIRGLSFGFLFFAILFYVLENNFFATDMEIPMLVSALVIIVIVVFYLLEMLKSERIIDLKKSHVFLLLIALAIWYACVSPMFIFSGYYNMAYPSFVEFRFGLLVILNKILYTYYILVFMYTLRNKVLELKAEKS